MKIKRGIAGVLCLTAIAGSLLFTGCGSDESAKSSGGIHLVSREDGSGTREAFSEITKVLEKNGDEKNDRTSKDAIIQNSTETVMSTVSTDKDAIGYISLGSLNDSVKALNINGAKADEENVKNGQYKLTRPFLLAYKDKLKDKSQDFMDFVLSNEGQEIVKNNGYVSVDAKAKFTSKKPKGDLLISGSTSITPLMEKLVEAYETKNPDLNINIQSNGSSAGITDAKNGAADIAMSSRNLKDSEKLESQAIAIDGIAVIVNKENKLENITMENLAELYMGNINDWTKLEEK